MPGMIAESAAAVTAARADPDAGQAAARRAAAAGGLTPAEQRVVAQLQARDREVRVHESAHKSAGGALAGGVSYAYQAGPDGRQYAVGGEVQIDTGAEGDPRATVAKMRRVIAAALAPAQPSAQDHAVAAAARAALAEAERQAREQDAALRRAAEADDAELRAQRVDLVA